MGFDCGFWPNRTKLGSLAYWTQVSKLFRILHTPVTENLQQNKGLGCCLVDIPWAGPGTSPFRLRRSKSLGHTISRIGFFFLIFKIYPLDVTMNQLKTSSDYMEACNINTIGTLLLRMGVLNSELVTSKCFSTKKNTSHKSSNNVE